MSTIIQMGDDNIMKATIYPKGLIFRAPKKSPFIIEIIERVEPQEGQGIFVNCFIKQPSKKTLFIVLKL